VDEKIPGLFAARSVRNFAAHARILIAGQKIV
jgi:hypothetical protein